MNSLKLLIDEFARLPGLGKKSASRIVYFLLKADDRRSQTLGQAILDLKKNLRECSSCGNYTDTDPCQICTDPGRDHSLLCVVEEAKDILTIEATNEYHGLYHVLGGVLSPLNGIGPSELRLRELVARLKKPVSELIIATNPTVEGDTTALYISKTVGHLYIPVSRLALGLPVGGDIEYADKLTIGRALKGRTRL